MHHQNYKITSNMHPQQIFTHPRNSYTRPLTAFLPPRTQYHSISFSRNNQRQIFTSRKKTNLSKSHISDQLRSSLQQIGCKLQIINHGCFKKVLERNKDEKKKRRVFDVNLMLEKEIVGLPKENGEKKERRQFRRLKIGRKSIGSNRFYTSRSPQQGESSHSFQAYIKGVKIY